MLDWLPQNVSTYGGDIDFYFYVIYYITATVFFLVAAAMIVFLIKYRYRADRKALYYHGNTTLEIIWTSATFIAMIVLALVSKPLWGKIKQEVPPTDIVVQVTGKQFNWEVLYPGPDKTFNTADDYQIDNEVHVPVNKPVRVMLASKDVIHSFFVPQLRLKQDTLPSAPDENGRPTRFIPAWFEATVPGQYEIPCAELCGFGHSGMLGRLFVHTPEEYDAWVLATWPPSDGSTPDSLATETPQTENQ